MNRNVTSMSRASAAQSEQMLSGTTEVILFCIFYSLMSVFRGCKSDENKDQSDDSTVIIRRSLLASSHLFFLSFYISIRTCLEGCCLGQTL